MQAFLKKIRDEESENERAFCAGSTEERWRGVPDALPDLIASLSDEELWIMAGEERQTLIQQVRARLARQLGSRGYPPEMVARSTNVLDPNALTLGFARRFTAYKRPNLLLADPARLARLLNDSARPVQLVLAGKAHPADAEGRQMIREWIDLAQRPEFRQRVVFLEDYDIALAQELVQGVDVWINTPRRPWEACGTSGMKVLVNGGLNLSTRDGWWEEAHAPEIGWASAMTGNTLRVSGMPKTPTRCMRSSSKRLCRNSMRAMRPECRGDGSSACAGAWRL
jgi:starch phosphorylase